MLRGQGERNGGRDWGELFYEETDIGGTKKQGYKIDQQEVQQSLWEWDK